MAQKHRNRTVRKHRTRTAKKHCRSKKRYGGMPSSNNSNPYAMVLYRPRPGGVDPKFRFNAKKWGISKKLIDKLLKRPSTFTPPRRDEDRIMSAVWRSVATEELANNTYEQAERLRATSFQSQNVAECIKTNKNAEELLKQAIVMGSLKARACLADMLLNGTTAGIGVNWDLVKGLLSGDVAMGPDCEGVLAHYRFKREYFVRANQGEIHDAATRSADAGSKYGQFVVGTIKLFEGDMGLAGAQFNLAAQQNYDQAQVALGELHLRANPPDQVEALRLFKLAAEQGNIHAFQLIANTHKKNALQRHDVNDYMEAVKWFAFRKEAGCLIAQNDLAELNADMKLHELQEATNE